MNENIFFYVYLVDFIDPCHARLGHVSLFYFLKINFLSLIYGLNSSSINKYEICVEAKTIKKTCGFIKTETELLSLIHTDLEDLKQTMIKGGKKYYVIFIDDFLRYTKFNLGVKIKLITCSYYI